jgi:hypothetical protein
MARRIESPKIVVEPDEPMDGFNIDPTELDERLENAVQKKESESERREKYWGQISDLFREAEKNPEDAAGYANQIEHLLLERKDFAKWLGEDELFEWLEENLGRTPQVELNKKGIIVSINNEEKHPG